MQFLDNLEGSLWRPMTARGWEKEETSVFLSDVGRDFNNNPKFQMQHDGQKLLSLRTWLPNPG